MLMPPYPVLCSGCCDRLAQFKIASCWSDGVTQELKTYGLCCEACLPTWFQKSRQKQMQCKLTTGETLDPAGIYHLEAGERDRRLPRMPELEEKLRQGAV